MTREEMLEIKSLMEDVVAPIKEDIKTLKEDVSNLKKDVRGLKEDVSNLKKDVSGLKEDVTSLKSEMADVKERLTRVELTQENIIIPEIKLLAEGHQNILDHIDGRIATKTDGLNDRVEVLEVVVRQHSRDISELKKAQ